MWSQYLNALEKRPIVTKGVTSAALYLLGDAGAQYLDGTISRKGYDTTRGRVALIWGGLIFAPVAHGWYNKLLNPLFPGVSTAAVLKKTILDQTVWALPANMAYLYTSNRLRGKSDEQCRQVTINSIADVMKANYLTWPWIQLFNFRFVPPPLQIPFINVCILGWSCFLALKATDSDQQQSAETLINKSGVEIEVIESEADTKHIAQQK